MTMSAKTTRRTTLGLMLATTLATPMAALAQQSPATDKAPTSDKTLSLEDLLKDPPLKETELGDPKASVTIIEYASLTCPHCAHFHEDGYQTLKKEFIDTGKVRFIFRDFPFDGLALAGTMLARCNEEKYFPMLELLFKQQETWAFGKDPEKELLTIARQAGFTQESFNACLQNQKNYEGVLAMRKKAYETFNVNSTPTIIINGKVYRGAMSGPQLSAAITAVLEEKK